MKGKEFVHAAALFVAALALAGCGGGGSDGSSGGTSTGGASSTVPAAGTAGTASSAESAGAASVVSANNAATVAGQVYGVASGLYGSGSTAAVAVKSLDALPQATPSIPGVADFAIRRLLSLRGVRADLSTKASQSANQYCSSGGAMAVTILDADNDGDLSSGDSGTIRFTGCKEAGITIDGSVEFASLSIAGSSATPSLAVGARFTYRQLSLGNGQDTLTVDGDLTLQATIANAAPYTFEYTGTGSALTMRSAAHAMTLTDFASTARLDTSAGTYACTTQGALSLDGQGGTLNLSSPTPLAGTLGSLPTTGVLVARAADGSAARLSVVSATGLTVESDGDGNGAWDTSQSLTWAQFRAR